MRNRRLLVACFALAFGLSPVVVGAQQKSLRVPFIKSAIPADPDWKGWKAVPSIELPLIPQVIAQPWNLTPSIARRQVSALHNGSWDAVRLTRKDGAKNSVMHRDTYRGPPALLVPVGKPAAIIM